MAKTIITLGREYCTGGRFIAEDVANALGIKLYDKELITMAAKNSGLSEEAVAASEKRHTHSLLYSLYTMGNELPLGDQVFILQSRIIKQLAEEGPCVILGRCGDYVLRERKDVLRVFVYAPKEWRLQYAKTNPLVKAKDEKGIKEEVEKTDRNRSAYYNYYTQNRWTRRSVWKRTSSIRWRSWWTVLPCARASAAVWRIRWRPRWRLPAAWPRWTLSAASA